MVTIPLNNLSLARIGQQPVGLLLFGAGEQQGVIALNFALNDKVFSQVLRATANGRLPPAVGPRNLPGRYLARGKPVFRVDTNDARFDIAAHIPPGAVFKHEDAVGLVTTIAGGIDNCFVSTDGQLLEIDELTELDFFERWELGVEVDEEFVKMVAFSAPAG